jgi:DNA polymerase III epsilon subunit-like protein
VLVGHNVAFDVQFLRAEFTRAGRRAPIATRLALDTLRGSYRTWPGRGRGGYRLGVLTEALGGDSSGWHGAEADVAMTAQLLSTLRRHRIIAVEVIQFMRLSRQVDADNHGWARLAGH